MDPTSTDPVKITATYTYPKSLVERARSERVNPLRHLVGNFWHYLGMFALLGLMISEADHLYGNSIALPLVAIPVLICSAIFALVARKQWKYDLKRQAIDYQIGVELDEVGVTSWWKSNKTVTP
jgi:membrane protein YdbS with pleckstrin-like domain